MASQSDQPASSSGTLPDTQPQTQIQTQPNTNPDHDPYPSFDISADRDLDAEIGNPAPATNGTADMDVSMNMDGSSANPIPPHADQPPVNGSNLQPTGGAEMPAVMEARIPRKKDASLREFLGKMDDYAPIIPDAVTDYYLTLAGLPPPPETDRRLARLLALATQKFIADIAADAYQYSRIRSTNTTSNNPLTGLGGAAGFGTNMPGGEGGEGGGKKGKDTGKNQPLGGPRAGYGGGGAGGGQGRTVLTMEDLGMAVGEYGVNVRRGEFYR